MSKHLKNVLLRMSQGMTQKEIARSLGISQPAVSIMLKRIKLCPHCNKPLNMELKK